MGDMVLTGFIALAVLGVVMVVIGMLRRSRALTLAGSALLATLAGAWVIGPAGVGLGVLVLGLGLALRGRACRSRGSSSD
jgi:hypothetical protein